MPTEGLGREVPDIAAAGMLGACSNGFECNLQVEHAKPLTPRGVIVKSSGPISPLDPPRPRLVGMSGAPAAATGGVLALSGYWSNSNRVLPLTFGHILVFEQLFAVRVQHPLNGLGGIVDVRGG